MRLRLSSGLALVVLSVACSDGQHSPSNASRPLKFIDIVSNYRPRSYAPTATCGLAADSTVYCWGSNRNSRLGRPTTGTRCPDNDPSNTIACALQPAPVPNAPKLASLVAGTDYFCGLTADGTPYCWGFSQTSDGSGIDFGETPSPLPGGLHLTQLGAGIGTLCGVATTGAGVCWGDYQGGMRGDATADPDTAQLSLTPNTIPGHTFSAIYPREYTTCGLATDGSAWCWGGDYLGGLGSSGAATQGHCGAGWAPCARTPVAVAGGLTFTSLAAGRYHFCGLTAGHQIFCWGGDANGALNEGEGGLVPCAEPGEPVRRCAPEPIAVALPLFASVVAGDATTCGISTSQQFTACWGNNEYGQAGNGGGPTSALQPVRGGHTFLRIAPGTDHTCGIAADSLAWCWGEGSAGALGDGKGEDSSEPVAVVGPAEP